MGNPIAIVERYLAARGLCACLHRQNVVTVRYRSREWPSLARLLTHARLTVCQGETSVMFDDICCKEALQGR